MTRPLRVQHPGGWTHAMSRGINKQPIFIDDRDRGHFLELLQTAVERFRIRLHAFVLMHNHFHLLVETPEGNLSACMKWIKQAYSMWFNLRHGRVGPLFQGRFKSVAVEDSAWAFELSLYIHLNPLRLSRFKLSRVERQAGAAMPEELPTRKEASTLLQELRRFPWSSYRAYGGYTAVPVWLTTETLLERAGGSNARQAYRHAVQERLTVGVEGELLEQIRDAAAVGSVEYIEKIRKRLRQAGREIANRKSARGAVAFEAVLKAVEQATGEKVNREKRGGLGRDLALKLARDLCGLTLQDLGARMGSMDYASVHIAIRRLEQKMGQDPRLMKQMDLIKIELLNVET